MKGYRTIVAIVLASILPLVESAGQLDVKGFLMPKLCDATGKIASTVGMDVCTKLVENVQSLYMLGVLALLAYLRFKTTTPVGKKDA